MRLRLKGNRGHGSSWTGIKLSIHSGVAFSIHFAATCVGSERSERGIFRQIALAQARGDLYIPRPDLVYYELDCATSLARPVPARVFGRERASVAQLDRASDYGSEGSRFNSWRMRQCYNVRHIDYN